MFYSGSKNCCPAHNTAQPHLQRECSRLLSRNMHHNAGLQVSQTAIMHVTGARAPSWRIHLRQASAWSQSAVLQRRTAACGGCRKTGTQHNHSSRTRATACSVHMQAQLSLISTGVCRRALRTARPAPLGAHFLAGCQTILSQRCASCLHCPSLCPLCSMYDRADANRVPP